MFLIHNSYHGEVLRGVSVSLLFFCQQRESKVREIAEGSSVMPYGQCIFTNLKKVFGQSETPYDSTENVSSPQLTCELGPRFLSYFVSIFLLIIYST